MVASVVIIHNLARSSLFGPICYQRLTIRPGPGVLPESERLIQTLGRRVVGVATGVDDRVLCADVAQPREDGAADGCRKAQPPVVRAGTHRLEQARPVPLVV